MQNRMNERGLNESYEIMIHALTHIPEGIKLNSLTEPKQSRIVK